MHDSYILRTGRRGCRDAEQLDNIAGPQPAGSISAEIAMDGHPPTTNQFLGCRPTLPQLLTDKGCQGAARRRFRHMKKLSVTAACHQCIPLEFRPLGDSRTERPANKMMVAKEPDGSSTVVRLHA